MNIALDWKKNIEYILDQDMQIIWTILELKKEQNTQNNENPQKNKKDLQKIRARFYNPKKTSGGDTYSRQDIRDQSQNQH